MLGTQTSKHSTQGNITVLFQGDSITDAGRDYYKSDDLGWGYPSIVAEAFNAKYPQKNVRFLSRGVSGNTVAELRNRWQTDCLDLKPDIVSILIGVNDVLGKFFWRNFTPGNFAADYRSILQQTKAALNSKIVLMTPFMLLEPAESMFNLDLNEKIEVVTALSKEFGTSLIPLHSIFAQAVQRKEPSYWSIDGVHPTIKGHTLIAQSWLEVMSQCLI